jgi:hypothetical protein
VKYNGWSLYWLLWIAVGFCVPEFYSLLKGKPQNTLSYQVWHLEGNGATFARYFVFAFLLWLLIHMVWRKFT